jgi:hypothetical protein
MRNARPRQGGGGTWKRPSTSDDGTVSARRHASRQRCGRQQHGSSVPSAGRHVPKLPAQKENLVVHYRVVWSAVRQFVVQRRKGSAQLLPNLTHGPRRLNGLNSVDHLSNCGLRVRIRLTRVLDAAFDVLQRAHERRPNLFSASRRHRVRRTDRERVHVQGLGGWRSGHARPWMRTPAPRTRCVCRDRFFF